MSNLGINHSALQKARLLAILALIVSMPLLSLTGCARQVVSVSGINSPIEINYTVNNPLTFEEHKEGNGNEFEYLYLTVDGLKNEEVEQSINDRIKAVYDELRIQDIPPYRGIKTQIKEGSEVIRDMISMNVTGNYNHILSVMLTKSTTYQDPAVKGYSEKDPEYYDGSKYFSEIETLNFDLNTGEEIKLKDLFCDDVDAFELVNDNLSRLLSQSYAEEEEYYFDSYSDIKLVESFKGLSEDQKFTVYPYGIALIFDYRTPQFDTQCMASMFMISFSDLGDHIAVTERFYNDSETIFASMEPLTKSLAMKNYKNDISNNDYYQDGLVNIYLSWRYSSSLPEEIKTKLNQMCNADDTVIREMNQIFSKMSQIEINEKGQGSYEVMIYADRMGNYINISKHSNQYMFDYFEQRMEYHCFDGETHKELGLGDLFVEGYDYKPVVIEAIKKSINEYDGIYEEEPTEKYTDQQAQEVFNRIEGFNLSMDEIYIPITHPEKGNSTYGLTVSIPYKDFGCENMLIFN